MRRYLFLFLAACTLYAAPGYGQISEITTFAFDSAAPRLFSGLAGMQMTVSDDQDNKQTDITLLATARFRYISEKTEYSLYCRQFWEQKDDGGVARKTFAMFNPTVGKYRLDPVSGGLRQRRVQFMPALLFNANSDRGLRGALQMGGLVSPWHFQNKRIGFSFGLGPLVSFENWNMYDAAAVAELPPDKQERIDFVNSHLKLHKGKYYRFTDLKAMLYADFLLHVSKTFRIDLGTFIQQGLLDPYNKTITDRYPELRKHYPHWVAELEASVTLFRDFSVTASCRMDYQKSMLALYKSNFEYYTMIGLNWRFRKSFVHRPEGNASAR
ncbi:hypothetical protein [uncultured Rikenella sp.]|uniref:hypothetical protein n=1 Tax=uncultured Rikenella sp. TaxID=368003 RepID=UPI002624EDFD|nr:hypothetical protein [uncultured Rikenella sp.]